MRRLKASFIACEPGYMKIKTLRKQDWRICRRRVTMGGGRSNTRRSSTSCSGCRPAAPTTASGPASGRSWPISSHGMFGPVLTLLAEARVGGDVPTPGGRARRDAIRRLWVDSLQYHRAEDVLITYPHGRIRSGWSSSAVWSRATDVLQRRIHFLQQGYVQGSVGHHDDAVVEPRVDPGGPIGERAYRVGAKIRGTARRTGPGD